MKAPLTDKKNTQSFYTSRGNPLVLTEMSLVRCADIVYLTFPCRQYIYSIYIPHLFSCTSVQSNKPMILVLQDNPPRACGAFGVQGDGLHRQPQPPRDLPGARGGTHHHHAPTPRRPVNQPDLTIRDQISVAGQQVEKDVPWKICENS